MPRELLCSALLQAFAAPRQRLEGYSALVCSSHFPGVAAPRQRLEGYSALVCSSHFPGIAAPRRSGGREADGAREWPRGGAASQFST